jgi:hypothetical protein
MDLLLDPNTFTQFGALVLLISLARPIACSAAALILTWGKDPRHRERVLKILCEDHLLVALAWLLARRPRSPRRR